MRLIGVFTTRNKLNIQLNRLIKSGRIENKTGKSIGELNDKQFNCLDYVIIAKIHLNENINGK